MKKLFLLVLFSMLIVVSCSDTNSTESIVAPTDDVVMQKEKPEISVNTAGKYPFMQRFLNVSVIWQLEANDSLYIKIPNYITYTITDEYFLTLTYNTYNIMLYINKPNKAYFIIPYYGTSDLIDVKLMAVFTHIDK